MTPELKKLWADALRSGKYVQGYSNLKDQEEKYCCMGVLAEVCGAIWVDTDEFKKIVDSPCVAGKDDRRLHPMCNGKALCPKTGAAYLSVEFLIEIGLSSFDQDMFVTMNDKGVVFLNIANVVETLPEFGGLPAE